VTLEGTMIGRYLANGLGMVALLTVLLGLYLAFVYAPADAQGDAQRIMYIHVPTAWVAFLAFSWSCVSLVYL
jgi:heme exporter protein C